MNRAEPAVIKLDTNGNIIEFSPAAEALFGCSIAEVMGRPIAELLPELDAGRLAAALGEGDLSSVVQTHGQCCGRTVDIDAIIMARHSGHDLAATLLVKPAETGRPSTTTPGGSAS